MAHLSIYTNAQLSFICGVFEEKVAGNKAELEARLKWKFTKETARIFESWGGFEQADPTVSKADLEAACTQAGLSKSGLNKDCLALLLALHKVERRTKENRLP